MHVYMLDEESVVKYYCNGSMMMDILQRNLPIDFIVDIMNFEISKMDSDSEKRYDVYKKMYCKIKKDCGKVEKVWSGLKHDFNKIEHA